MKPTLSNSKASEEYLLCCCNFYSLFEHKPFWICCHDLSVFLIVSAVCALASDAAFVLL